MRLVFSIVRLILSIFGINLGGLRIKSRKNSLRGGGR